jgi:signal transduction histidine kinase
VRLPRLLRTSTVRLTLLYAAVFATSVLVLFGIAAWSATGFMARQIDNTVANELAEVQADAGSGGDDAVREVVAGLIVRSPGVSYLLQDASGRVLAGNMLSIHPRPGLRVLDANHLPAPAHAVGGIRGRGVVLPSGSYLFVGLSSFELAEMQDAIARAAMWGLGATLAIALAGGLATSSWLLRRIDAVGLASREIMAGDLARRIPLRGTDDEFDRLAASLNAMLDRITDLMNGLQQVSSDIAHDLRTPLTRLRQRLERARRRSATVEELQTAIDGAIGDSEDILDLFAALLRIAQIEAGTRRSGFTSAALSELLVDLGETYRPEFEERGQSLALDVAPDLHVHGDRELLIQLFANLIENAFAHCPPGTQLSVAAQAIAGGVRVIVADNGPGIPDGLRQKVLQRFYRLEVSRTTPGSGLGLSMAAAIAELHDARLTLGDNRPGLRCELVFPHVKTPG